MGASIAYGYAKKGARVLLIELGPISFYENFFHLGSMGPQPVGLVKNLDIVLLTAESCLKEYVLHYLRVKKIYEIFFENRVMRAFIQAAPAVAELSILGKITSQIRHVGPPMEYDHVVVDAYATGHFLALLRSPAALGEMIHTGPFGVESRKIIEVLLNPQCCDYTLVATPEPLPVQETKELQEALMAEFGIKAQVLVNKVLNIEPTEESVSQLGQITKVEEPSVLQFCTYLNYVRRRQDSALLQLKDLDKNLKYFPWLMNTTEPIKMLELLSERYFHE